MAKPKRKPARSVAVASSPHLQWGIASPLEWARAWIVHRGAPHSWTEAARRESRRVEAAGGYLAVLSWPGGACCFVEWSGLPYGASALPLDDSILAAAYAQALDHSGECPPLLRVVAAPIDRPPVPDCLREVRRAQ